MSMMKPDPGSPDLGMSGPPDKTPLGPGFFSGATGVGAGLYMASRMGFEVDANDWFGNSFVAGYGAAEDSR